MYDSHLTEAQRATNNDTWRHINRVQHYMHKMIGNLMHRALVHDQSKLASPEVELFTEVNGALAGITYNSPEYHENLAKLKPALDHHYANNRHHPQWHKRGVEDMTLLDLVELLADWKAASERHNDGNINKSIEVNAERFNMSPELRRILENTVKELQID